MNWRRGRLGNPPFALDRVRGTLTVDQMVAGAAAASERQYVMVLRRHHFLVLIAWAPLCLASLAVVVAYRGWRVNDDHPGNVDQFRQLTFGRDGRDLRVSLDRFRYDSCPAWDDYGSATWYGEWKHVAGFSLWWALAIAGAPPMVALLKRRDGAATRRDWAARRAG